jgi:hypothetical protein
METTLITFSGMEYHLRFEQDDVIACENELRMGYTNFFRVEDHRPITLSLILCRTLIHHGLRTQTKRGELEYVFVQTPVGASEAGLLIQEHLLTGGSLIEIWETCFDAFVQGWFGKPKTEKSDEDKTKN